MSGAKVGFEMRKLRLSLADILPVKQYKNPEDNIRRYRTIRDSIKEAGLIEPLVVYPVNGDGKKYFLLDGHLRVIALKQLGHTEADCIISKDDECFTYNARINRVSPIQEHKMMLRAVNNGVSIERIAAALNLTVREVEAAITLLDGIHAEAAEMLKDKAIAPKANLLGWLYDNTTNPPRFNIPSNGPPTFDGLIEDQFFNELVIPGEEKKVYAFRGTTGWPSCPNCNQVPTPDPHEEFEHVTEQIFGKRDPAPGDQANMSGFLQNYYSTAAGFESCDQIMQTYGPDEANVINDLARSFAVSDAWFASVPTQTWANRAFAHSGSSDGHLNNDNYKFYGNQTIFNVLTDQGIPWKVFSNTYTACLTFLQFWLHGGLRDHFHRYSAFDDACRAAADAAPEDKLPAYSFIEPRFLPELLGIPGDYHPPHNICRGETFLAEVYDSVRNSPYRDKIMLIVTFDEHGGCFDHVPPPTGAAPPAPHPVSLDGKFKFDRFGVRVPAIVVSSYVEPGTVFRASPGEAPYDHTSVLATLRDWLGLDKGPGGFLPSPRIQAAPTLDRVLTRPKGQENRDWPEINAKCSIDGSGVSNDTPLNDVQKSILAAAKSQQAGMPPAEAAHQAKRLTTYEHGAMFLQFDNKAPS